MLDKELKGILATGRPQDLRDHSENEFVRRFFNRQGESDTPAEKHS
jgi:phospholipid/cholesterol/gamma-HCH transport system ATP-binding protein